MQKDLKIGMILGSVLAIIATVWLATRPSLSTKARMLHFHNAGPRQEPIEQTNFAPNLPNTPSTGTTNEVEAEQSSSLIRVDKLQQPTQLNLPDFTAYYKSEKIKTQRFHIVGKGETLSDISYKYYGSANKWQKILDANRNVIKDANKLRPGVKLIIPE